MKIRLGYLLFTIQIYLSKGVQLRAKVVVGVVYARKHAYFCWKR